MPCTRGFTRKEYIIEMDQELAKGQAVFNGQYTCMGIHTHTHTHTHARTHAGQYTCMGIHTHTQTHTHTHTRTPTERDLERGQLK